MLYLGECGLEHLQNEFTVTCLLICGTYADPVSPVSHKAFKLLMMILADQDPPLYPRWGSLLDEFAAIFVFTDNMTTQMVAAFPIFWNRRTVEDPSDTNAYPAVKVLILPFGERPKKKKTDVAKWPKNKKPEAVKWQKAPNKTPLEFYSKALLHEPPVSDVLLRSILDVLQQYEESCNAIRTVVPTGRTEWLAWQKQLVERDCVFFYFLVNRFSYDGAMCDLTALPNAIARSPIDDTWDDEDGEFRVPHNGIILKVARFLQQSQMFKMGSEYSMLFELAPKLEEDRVCRAIVSHEEFLLDFDAKCTLLK
jgi:hypothetical protein